MNAALSSVLALIQMVLPLLGQSQAGLVGTIIKALTTWLPMIVTEIETAYEPVKAIIAALHSTEVTAEQKADLHALDNKMDAAFEASVAGLDPDADDA